MLVTPAWLAAHLHDANLVLLHVGQRDTYPARHIPGARFIELSDISVSDRSAMKMPPGMSPPPAPPLTGPKNGLMLEMPTADQLRSQLAKFGISNDSRIIVYQADDYFSPSTRVAFTLDYVGLGDRASVLDGGLTAWVAGHHDVTDVVPPAATPGTLSPLSLRPTIATLDYVRAHESARGVSIVDARAASFYDGVMPADRDAPARAGHIPGAKSVPFDTPYDDTGKLKSPDQLAAIFAQAGVQPADTVVGYCHVGQQATAMLFAARTLGHPVLLFDGSMDEYNKHADLPLVIPPAKGRP